jgi:predicted RNA binding protein YcfA (HicA-like mRNA interferase family)
MSNMVRLPVVSGRDAVRALEKLGCVVDRQKGSHIVLRHAEPPFRRIRFPIMKKWRRELSALSFAQPA